MAAKEACAYCNAKYVGAPSFCPKCKQPTRHISADERILWELSQWETTHGPSSRPRRADPSRDTAASPAAAAAQPARTAEAPAAHAPTQPARRSEPARRVAPETPARRQNAVARASLPAPARPSIERPAASVKPAPALPRQTVRTAGVVRSIGRPAASAPAASAGRATTGVLAAEAASRIDVEEIEVPEIVADNLPEIVTDPRPVERERPAVATVVHRVRVPQRPAEAAAPAPAQAAVIAPSRAKPAKTPKVKTPKPPKAAKAPKRPKSEKAPKAPKAAKPKAEPKPSKARLRLQPNEKIQFQARGWSRMLPATLIVTTYRVALVRLGRARWIPLEEVRGSASTRSGLTVEASIELFRFRARGQALADALTAIESSLREARRPNSPRHDAAVTQEWCDRCEIWDTHTGRMRLWLNRHPLLIVALVGALVVLVKVYTTPH